MKTPHSVIRRGFDFNLKTDLLFKYEMHNERKNHI